MRERINRLARGIIDSEAPQVVITPEQVEEQVPASAKTRGELMVTSSNNLYIKGLVYSSNPRVTISNNAFGGLRNRIVFEINSQYLKHGETIKGSFYLVTNGGEKEIPYSLRVQSGVSGSALERLKTAEDYARLAKKDLDLALQLFEYQDFIQAPFMEDGLCRTIYDGLKGRPGRRNLLEEFLVALKVKEPVRLSVNTEKKSYDCYSEGTQDWLEIRSSGWGYVQIQVQADGDFIELVQSQFTDQDFKGGLLRLPFRVRRERLHGGKNFGSLHLTTLRENFTVEIEALVPQEEEKRGTTNQGRVEPEKLYPYLAKRLDLEAGVTDRETSLNQMSQELQKLREEFPEDDLPVLLQAELMLMGGRREAAAGLLGERGERMAALGEKERERYCYFRYLNYLLNPGPGAKEGLIRLLNQYLERMDGESFYLFFLLLEVDERLKQNPLELYLRMKNMYQDGCRSPFLYLAASRLLEIHPDLMASLGEFEVQVVYLAAKKGFLNRTMAEKTASYALNFRYYKRIYQWLLEKIYELYPLPQVLEALCALLIRGNQKGSGAFRWYSLALEQGVNLTRLYEYYLYALPKNYDHLLPKEVLLYFSYDKDLDDENRCVLYRNILTYMNPSSELYQAYMRPMEQFAMEQLLRSRINSSLAIIYDHMIYKDMIDRRAARVLPGILRSYRIQCQDPRMKYVIVRYQELAEDQAFALDGGVAFVPIFSDRFVLLFQDAFGSRYLDVSCYKIPVMDKPELLERCYEVCPEHPMLRLIACRKLLEEGIKEDSQASFLERLMEDLNLNPVYREQLLSAVTDYYCQKAKGQEGGSMSFDCAYLVQMDKEELKPRQRQKICETLISQNYMREAYEMIRLYGSQYISAKSRMKLCDRMILQNLFDQDELLLDLSYGVFREGCGDSVILDYLCEHFNGTVEQMYQVLIQAIQEHVETYDLEERLLAQMMFTGQTAQIDSVFQLYTQRKNTRESVVKAYFTEKSIAYFLRGEKVGEPVFRYLEGVIGASIEKNRVPTIYLLALTKYYASCTSLQEDQARLCRIAGGLLINEGLVFSYTRDLSRHMAVPEDIMDKAMVEYHGRKDSRPELMVRILPGEEEYHSEEMHRVYQGIFVKRKVLFEGETMEYQIYDLENGVRTLTAEGQAVCDHKLEGKENSRFVLLNHMGKAFEEKDEEALKNAMEEYLKKAAVLSELFPTV